MILLSNQKLFTNTNTLIILVILFIYQFIVINSSTWGLNRYCLNSNKNGCLDELQLYANPLISPKEFNPINYDQKLFCTLDNINNNKTRYLDQSLGQVLFGDRLQYIPYKFKFNHNITCEKVCKRTINNNNDLNYMANIINKTYTQRWYGDNIPVIYCHMNNNDIKQQPEYCNAYFYVGCNIVDDIGSSIITRCTNDTMDVDKFVIFNHLIFKIVYKEEKLGDNTYGIIIHIQVDLTNSKNRCNGDDNLQIFYKENNKNKLPSTIDYSYSVIFIKDNQLPITDRWKYMFYYYFNKAKYQWMNLCAITFIFLMFSIALGLNFYNLLSRDIIRYTQLIDNAQLDIQDEYGWKVLRGDVFRPPRFPLILATSVGCGVQLICMVMISLLFAAIGLLSTHTHGALITCVVVFYIIFGIVSGYVSARLYKFFGGIRWKICVIGTSIIHPGLLFAMIYSVNFWLWIYDSPSVIKPLPLIGLFFLWILVSVPLTFLGSFIGFRQSVIQSPVKINHIPRFIPRQGILTHRIICIMFGGLPSFICIYWQLYFLIKSVWIRLNYAMFGFLFVAALLAVIVCAEVCILLGYMHLSSEDYRWQWRSFFTAASMSFYCFIIVTYYYTNSNVTGSLGAYAYFTYSLVILYMLALAMGSVGFLSCFFVFLKMYSSIKVD